MTSDQDLLDRMDVAYILLPLGGSFHPPPGHVHLSPTGLVEQIRVTDRALTDRFCTSKVDEHLTNNWSRIATHCRRIIGQLKASWGPRSSVVTLSGVYHIYQ